MDKIMLSLVVCGLSICGDCFADEFTMIADKNKPASSQSIAHVFLGANKVEKKPLLQRGKKVLEQKDVRIAMAIGGSLAAYYFIQGIRPLVNSKLVNLRYSVQNGLKSYLGIDQIQQQVENIQKMQQQICKNIPKKQSWYVNVAKYFGGEIIQGIGRGLAMRFSNAIQVSIENGM